MIKWFNELHQTRRFSYSGPEPITYTEIRAWAQLTGRKLQEFETKTLKRLDQLWLSIYHD